MQLFVHLIIGLVVAANVDAGAPSTESPSGGPSQASADYELRRTKDGSGDLIYDTTGFTARIARDGSVTFRDKHLTMSLALLPHLGGHAVPSGVPSLESILRSHGTKRPPPRPVSAEEQASLYGSRLPIPTVTPYRPDPREVCQYPQSCFFNASVFVLSIKGDFDLTDELMRLSPVRIPTAMRRLTFWPGRASSEYAWPRAPTPTTFAAQRPGSPSSSAPSPVTAV